MADIVVDFLFGIAFLIFVYGTINLTNNKILNFDFRVRFPESSRS